MSTVALLNISHTYKNTRLIFNFLKTQIYRVSKRNFPDLWNQLANSSLQDILRSEHFKIFTNSKNVYCNI
jgi:hypothetical protein